MPRIKLTVALFFTCYLLSGQDFEVSPVLMSFNSNPGEIQTRSINLINHSAKPQKYTFKISDYEVDSTGNKKSLPAGSTKRSISDWVTVNPSLVELTPNQSATVEVILTVPKDGFSTKWGMIYVEVAREQSATEADQNLATGVIVVPRIAVLVKQSPPNSVNYKAVIEGLREITSPKDATRSFEVTVVNIGDNIIDANVSLAVANIETAKEERFNPVQVTVYPEKSRKVILQLPSKLARGQYALAAILDYGHRQPLEGTQIMIEAK